MQQATETILLRQVMINGDTQMRVGIDQDTVAEYAAAYEAGAEMPPIEVVFDGIAYWLVDGFHRFHAMRQARIDAAKVVVRQGTLSEARWLACAANTKHGLRRTNLDKRMAIKKAMELKPNASDRDIALHCGVDHKTVQALRAKVVPPTQTDSVPILIGEVPQSISGPLEQPVLREGSDGRLYPASREKPEPPVKLDAVGREVPERIEVEFTVGREWGHGVLRDCSDLFASIRKHLDGPYGRSAPQARLKQIEEQLRYIVRESMIPHTICPMCSARGCTACHSRGWHTEETWRTVPEELRIAPPRRGKPAKPPHAAPMPSPASASDERF